MLNIPRVSNGCQSKLYTKTAGPTGPAAHPPTAGGSAAVAHSEALACLKQHKAEGPESPRAEEDAPMCAKPPQWSAASQKKMPVKRRHGNSTAQQRSGGRVKYLRHKVPERKKDNTGLGGKLFSEEPQASFFLSTCICFSLSLPHMTYKDEPAERSRLGYSEATSA